MPRHNDKVNNCVNSSSAVVHVDMECDLFTPHSSTKIFFLQKILNSTKANIEDIKHTKDLKLGTYFYTCGERCETCSAQQN